MDLDKVIRKILRLHVPVECYLDSNNNPISNQSLCMYALIQPKSQIKALSLTVKECMDKLSDNEPPTNVLNLFKKNIGKNIGKNICDALGDKYRQIDLDTKQHDQLAETIKTLKLSGVIPYIKTITETKGGYHIIYIKNESIGYKWLYKLTVTSKFKKISHDGKEITDNWFSITNQPLVVVPGTFQGGFQTKIVDTDDFLRKYDD